MSGPTDLVRQLLEEPPDTDECIVWPYGISGRSHHGVYRGSTVGRTLLGLERGDERIADNSRDMVAAGRSLTGERNPSHRSRLPRCQAQQDADARPERTHTCDRVRDHQGPHRCPVCGSYWGMR